MVSIICCTMRPSFMENIFSNYKRQVLERKEMIVILNRDDMDMNKWIKKAKEYKNVVVYQVPERFNLGKCLNEGIKKAKYKIIAKFDDDDYYAPHFLIEAVDTLNNINTSIVGKNTSYVYFEEKKALMVFREEGEKRFCRTVKGGTLVFKRSVWDKVKFNENQVSGCDVSFLRKCRNEGLRIYSVSKDNYVCVRREDLSSHTQKTDAKLYMSRCKFICRTNDYIPKITRKFKPEVKSE